MIYEWRGDQQKKKLPSSSSFGFSFFFLNPKSPIIYLSLFSFSLCVYLYIDIHTQSPHLKKKYRIPHVWSLIGSAQYRNVVAQGETKRREKKMCVFFCVWWANGLYVSSSCCGSIRRTLLFQRAGWDGGGRVSPSGVLFDVPFSIGGQIDLRSPRTRTHTHTHSTTSKSIICNYLYFKNEQGNNM